MLRTAAVLMVLGLTACPKPEPPPPPPPPPPVEEPAAEPEPEPEPEPVEIIKQNFQRVNFVFASTDLAGDSMAALRENASILQEHPDVRVEIQGHADERGTTEFNMGLGERRAEIIVSKLTSMGVNRSRLTTISYGEERPLTRGAGESVWSQNRRAEFRVLSGGGEAVEGTTR